MHRWFQIQASLIINPVQHVTLPEPEGGPALQAHMDTTLRAAEIFQHVRVVIGIVLGLGITRLLTGLAGFLQHPTRRKAYPVHIGWTFMVLLTLIHFWWWEFGLIDLERWTFEIYLFLIGYAILLFLLCTLLFPDTLSEYSGYEDFFISRRGWFFAIYGLTIVFDVVDSLIKGPTHYALFAQEYWFRVPIYLILCGVAIWTPDRRFHTLFVTVGLVYELTWIFRLFNNLT